MTQLEQTLTKQLKMQQEAFIQELKEITNSYQKNMELAQSVIEKQNKTLKRYEKVSTNWQISINQEQLDDLERGQNERVQLLERYMQELKENLMKQLDELERKQESLSKADKDLLEKLNDVLKKL